MNILYQAGWRSGSSLRRTVCPMLRQLPNISLDARKQGFGYSYACEKYTDFPARKILDIAGKPIGTGSLTKDQVLQLDAPPNGITCLSLTAKEVSESHKLAITRQAAPIRFPISLQQSKRAGMCRPSCFV